MLLNKIALSSFAFKSANALLFFQCALCMVLVLACKAAKLVKVRSLLAGARDRGCAGKAAASYAVAHALHVGPLQLPQSAPPLARRSPPCPRPRLQVEPFSWGVVRVWLPVNVIFVGMIGTSFWALRSLNVGMVTGEAAAHTPACACHQLCMRGPCPRLASSCLPLACASSAPHTTHTTHHPTPHTPQC